MHWVVETIVYNNQNFKEWKKKKQEENKVKRLNSDISIKSLDDETEDEDNGDDGDSDLIVLPKKDKGSNNDDNISSGNNNNREKVLAMTLPSDGADNDNNNNDGMQIDNDLGATADNDGDTDIIGSPRYGNPEWIIPPLDKEYKEKREINWEPKGQTRLNHIMICIANYSTFKKAYALELNIQGLNKFARLFQDKGR